jgi:hypothetical protein
MLTGSSAPQRTLPDTHHRPYRSSKRSSPSSSPSVLHWRRRVGRDGPRWRAEGSDRRRRRRLKKVGAGCGEDYYRGRCRRSVGRWRRKRQRRGATRTKGKGNAGCQPRCFALEGRAKRGGEIRGRERTSSVDVLGGHRYWSSASSSNEEATERDSIGEGGGAFICKLAIEPGCDPPPIIAPPPPTPPPFKFPFELRRLPGARTVAVGS